MHFLWHLFVNLMSWLEYNSAISWTFSCFSFWKLQKCPKQLGLNHLSTYLELKDYYIHSRDHSEFWSKMKTKKKSRITAQVNSSSWQINAAFVIMLPPCFSFCWMGYFPIPSKVRLKSDANHIFYHMAGHHYIYNADLNLVNWWNCLLDLVNFCKKE